MKATASDPKPWDLQLRLMIGGLIVWVLLQLPRLIAIPLIQDVLAGVESPAWMFPAILDIVVAVAAPFVAFALWRNRGLAVWVVAITFFVVSIVDHADSVTTGLLTSTPRVFGGAEGPSPAIVSGSQGVIDVVALVLLTLPKVKSHYLGSLGSLDDKIS